MLLSIFLLLPAVLADLSSPKDVAPVEDVSRLRRSNPSTASPLTIETVYEKKLLDQMKDKSRDLMYYIANARKYFRDTLKVKQPVKSIKVAFPPTVPMTEYYYVDFVLYVYADENCSGDKLASAGSTSYDQNTDRPLAGSMGVCMKKFLAKKDSDDHLWETTILHEMTHALVFAPYLFTLFRDDNGNKRAGTAFTYDASKNPQVIPNVVEKVTRNWEVAGKTINRDVYLIATPKVKEMAREYFNCATLEGAELEDGGLGGTMFSHWEKRLFENEAMAGSATQVYAMSTISLALFDDSGWYEVDYSKAQKMSWGYKKGCDFAKKSCLSWIKAHKDPSPFCKENNAKRCGNDRRAKVMCSDSNVSPKVDYYKYKGADLKIYGQELADYCPYYRVYNDISADAVDGADTRCTYPHNKGTNYSLEVFSSHGRCFELKDNIHVEHRMGATTTHFSNVGCFETKCEDNKLFVKTQKSRFYPCHFEGQLVHVQKKILHVGLVSFQIKCPLCSAICGGQCSAYTGSKNIVVGDTKATGQPRHLAAIVTVIILAILC